MFDLSESASGICRERLANWSGPEHAMQRFAGEFRWRVRCSASKLRVCFIVKIRRKGGFQHFSLHRGGLFEARAQRNASSLLSLVPALSVPFPEASEDDCFSS
jgi:hypothetical protein